MLDSERDGCALVCRPVERRRRAHRQRRLQSPHGRFQRGDIAGADKMRVRSLIAKCLGNPIAKAHLPG